ncbi:HSP90 family protein [Microbacteriaceae bacterium VKM Ac-2854]|nr:HSP90 family protein [Microbacteriaceae bacterium VKM Ac-2854]
MNPSNPLPDAQPFQVHLGGIIELLSRNIYSGPRVYLRELLQNGTDALSARQEFDGGGTGIRITPADGDGSPLVVQDDGIGLTAAEVSELLATVGRSSKRDLFELPRTDRLGQFGIGLLSCFMIADEIVVHSRSARGGAVVEWVGRIDGTFTVRESPAEPLAVGTRVSLSPRPGERALTDAAAVLDLARRFGEHLPVAVRIDLPAGGTETINREAVFARPFARRDPAVMEYGREVLGARPLDAIELVVPGTATRGAAFVLPYAPAPGARQATRAYLGGMLLAESTEELLPEWAFFVRCVIDSSGLHPTASREAFVDDDALAETREAIGAALRRWVLGLAASDPRALADFLAVHQLSLRSLAQHDDELASFIVPLLTIETSNGRSTIGEFVRAHPHVRFTETVDEFRQIAGITPFDAPIVNGGFAYDAELLHALPGILAGVSVERLRVTDALDGLDEPSLAERPAARALAKRADAALADLDCTVTVRRFDAAVPALYVADPSILRRLRRDEVREVTTGFWSQMLDRVDEAEGSDVAGSLGSLCLNWNNPLVRTLGRLGDELVFTRSIRLLYCQALLAGHRPLRAVDRAALTDSMTDLVQLSVGLTGDDTTLTTQPDPEEDPR